MRRHLMASLMLAGLCGLGLVLGGCSSEGCGHGHHNCHTSHQASWHGYCAQSECCGEDACCEEDSCCSHSSCGHHEQCCQDDCCEDSCCHEACCRTHCKGLQVWYACPHCEFVSASAGTCVHCGAPLEQRQAGTVTSPEGQGGQQASADQWGQAQHGASVCPYCGQGLASAPAPANNADVSMRVETSAPVSQPTASFRRAPRSGRRVASDGN